MGFAYGTILDFNNWWLENLNFTSKEFSQLTNLDITHPEDLDKSKLWLTKIVNGEIDKYQIEKRYIIKTIVKIGPKRIKAIISLSDRAKMRYPVLIGRKLLKNRFVVDVSELNYLSLNTTSLEI